MCANKIWFQSSIVLHWGESEKEQTILYCQCQWCQFSLEPLMKQKTLLQNIYISQLSKEFPRAILSLVKNIYISSHPMEVGHLLKNFPEQFSAQFLWTAI